MLIVHSALIFIIGSALMNGLFVAISVFWLGLHIYEISDEEDYKRKTRMEEQDNVLP